MCKSLNTLYTEHTLHFRNQFFYLLHLQSVTILESCVWVVSDDFNCTVVWWKCCDPASGSLRVCGDIRSRVLASQWESAGLSGLRLQDAIATQNHLNLMCAFGCVPRLSGHVCESRLPRAPGGSWGLPLARCLSLMALMFTY